MDVDGRVVRLDSAAKIVAPGVRVGWVSAPKHFVDTFCVLNETSVQFPSGPRRPSDSKNAAFSRSRES